MVLKFCPKCEKLLTLKKANDKIFLNCTNCDLLLNLDDEALKTKEKMKLKEERGKGAMKDENVLATYGHVCKKCGHNKVQVLDLGIFISDEDNLIMLKCGKCGASERIGRKTS